jgi:hypothetical protein
MCNAVFNWPNKRRFMKKEILAKRSSRLSIILRIVGASFLCFVNLAITLPNMRTVSNHQVSCGPGTAAYLAFFVAPLILVFVGMKWCRLVEEIGWALLIVFLAARFIS